MLNGALARRYAQALYELAVEMTVLDQIDRELCDMVKLVTDHQELKSLLNHPNIDVEAKKETVGKILDRSVSELSKHFLYLLIDRKRQNLLSLIQREYTCLANEARNIAETKVTSAAPLTSSQEDKLKQVIAKITGKNVQLSIEVNPDLVGGVKLQIGDRVMDGSISTALDKLREELRKTSIKPQQEAGVS
ncbi:MAG: ATP synthase subunit delta [Candidatus Dichloromethanomonas elyunquensis]|nr:MAG: ATP synthase subunit delta [Candidatus Dichloromethanomonas elyunquensis]